MDAPCTTDGKRCAFTTAHTVRPQGYVAKADGQRFALPTAFADGYYTAVTTADIYIFFYRARAGCARAPLRMGNAPTHDTAPCVIGPRCPAICVAGIPPPDFAGAAGQWQQPAGMSGQSPAGGVSAVRGDFLRRLPVPTLRRPAFARSRWVHRRRA